MKRKRSTFGLLLLCATLMFGTSNTIAASKTDHFENGKFSIEGKVQKVNLQQVQSFSGIEANVRVPYELDNIEYYEVQGTKKGDGNYYFDYEMITKDEKVVSAPVRYDEKQQKLLIKVGTAPNDINPIEENEGTTASSTAPPLSKAVPTISSFSTLSTTSVSALSTTETGKFRTIWEDPVKANVNWVRDNLTFSYDGSSVSYISGSDERWWLSNTGWWEQSHSITSYYTGSTQVTVSTDDHFMNDTFCVGNPTTHVYYTGNRINGFSNGAISGSVSTSASGGCSSWLSYYSELSH